MTALPRKSLLQQVDLCRNSLTLSELDFLDELVVNGNDDQILSAAKRLSDPGLFPRSSSPLPGIPQARLSDGSTLRREALQVRRQSQVHGQIWKAHANGLAVTHASSRRSFEKRRSSLLPKRILASSGEACLRSSLSQKTTRASSGEACLFPTLPLRSVRPTEDPLWDAGKEEKKSSDEEVLALPLEVRRASENAYCGVGMEIVAPSIEGEEVMKEESTSHDKARQLSLIMRRASANDYCGEGVELSEWNLEERRKALDQIRQTSHTGSVPRRLAKGSTFDETSIVSGAADANIQRCFSEDGLSSVLTVHREKRSSRRIKWRVTALTVSSDDEEDSDDEESYNAIDFDAWRDTTDGANVEDLPFRILGTSAEDASSHPHVLSPPLMEALQEFMPLSKTSDNFWMKYSMVRDGASMHTFLQHARGAKHSILALETVDGEVFGSFTNVTWHKTWNSFGGGEAFLWRMRHSRQTKCHSIIDQARLESEIDVYPYTGENNCIQLCTSQKIAVGGGCPDNRREPPTSTKSLNDIGNVNSDHDFGHGLHLESNLMQGTSSPCVTFGSPSLSKSHSDGSLFEIINMELWTMTPCYSEADAQKLELEKLFLTQHSSCDLE